MKEIEKDVNAIAIEMANYQYQVMADYIMRRKVPPKHIKKSLKNKLKRMKKIIQESNLKEKKVMLSLSDEQLGVLASQIAIKTIAQGIKAPTKQT